MSASGALASDLGWLLPHVWGRLLFRELPSLLSGLGVLFPVSHAILILSLPSCLGAHPPSLKKEKGPVLWHLRLLTISSLIIDGFTGIEFRGLAFSIRIFMCGMRVFLLSVLLLRRRKPF